MMEEVKEEKKEIYEEIEMGEKEKDGIEEERNLRNEKKRMKVYI